MRALAALALAFAGCAAATEIKVGDMPATVFKPAGKGPFPAVVMMHDCSGLGPRSSGAPGRWAQELVAAGYVVVMPDSFSTRGFPGGVCTNPDARRAEVSPRNRARDAHDTLKSAQELPYVDKGRIGLMGGSHGGSTTLAAMTRPGFAAGIALYPRCIDRGVYQPAAPVLILIGEKDDWTPAGPCERLVQRTRAAGRPVSIKVYPGAHHSFDSHAPERYVAARVNPAAPGGRGATTGGNAPAWADSKLEVARFFAEHLK